MAVSKGIVWNTNNVTASAMSTGGIAGGIVGENTESGDIDVIVNTVAVDVTLDTEDTDTESGIVGGIIGINKKSGYLTVTDGSDDTQTSLIVIFDGEKSIIGGIIGDNQQDFQNVDDEMTNIFFDTDDCETFVTANGSNDILGGVIGQNTSVLDGQWSRVTNQNSILSVTLLLNLCYPIL